MEEKLGKIDVLGVGFTNTPENQILEYIVSFLKKGKGKCFITTPNPEILVYANHHKPFQDILNSAEISLADGVGVVVASRLLGKPLKNRITGIDFMKNLCEIVSRQPITVGFLGGKGDVALRAAECLRLEFPKLQILLAEAGNPDEKTADWLIDFSRQSLAKDQRPKTIDILFVGYGFPKQEQWIYENLDQLPVRVAMTVGGAFDILSASLPRAPRFLRQIGLEWFWRLLLQPSRITRQVKLLEFVWLVLKAVVFPSSK
jgi:N-acetylglucosaminyldiphosphoundecaprenol N-acetyl-beta-D-mannosaminyltransferase